MAEKTLEGHKASERRNPFSPGRFYEDTREIENRKGRLWEHGEGTEDDQRVVVVRMRWRDATNRFEEYVRSSVRASADESRGRKVLDHADSLADEMGMPREEFYLGALIEYIEKRENERIGRELNEAYGKVDQSEDLARLNDLVGHYDPRLADE